MTTDRLSIRRQGFLSILLLTALVLPLPAQAVRVIYVDRDASHFSPDGTTWERAYRELQQGLNASKILRNSLGSDTEPIEVWVAEGTYVPTEARGGMGWTGNGRDELGFTVFGRNIQIYGGFDGTETSRDERDFMEQPCILDGENLSYHVIYVDQDEQVNETVVLDGFTVRRGRAMGDQCCGDNRGGAMTFQSARMTVINCLFEDNQAGDEGGAVFTFSSGSTFINCRFFNNRSWGGDGVGGGAVWATGSTTFINCVFAGNQVGNSSFGGALVANQPIVVNCVFHDNISGRDFNNDDQPYGALHLQSLNTGNAQVSNTILWDNRTDQGVLKQISGFSIQNSRVTYCNIQGGWTGGTANIDQDPLFVDAASRDYNLDTGSPCIDAGNSGALPADTFDIDHDGDTAERIPYDLQLAPRFMDDAVANTGTDGGTGLPVVEMGAYERPRDCDQNGIPDIFEIREGTAQDCNDNGIIDVCETDPGDPDGDGETAPDCNGNGIPDECEVEGGLCTEGCLSDCNGNGVPDECDVAGGCSFTLSLLDNTTGLAGGRVLGPPDDRWIGIGGQTVTFDWRCGRIADGPGVDFVVYEADSDSAEFDQINVLVSRNGTDFESVKTSETAPVPVPGDDNHGDPAFARGYDIGSKGFDWVRYVRLEGAGDEPGGDNTGFDLDAIGAVYPEPTSADCDGNGIPDECGLSFDGLFATYYDNTDLSGAGVSRRDPRVDFDWGDGAPAAGIGPDSWSARWESTLTPPTSDLYTFFVETGGGARLWVGGVLRIDAWTTQPVTEHSSAQVELAQGVPVTLVLEYFNDTGDAVAKLRWKPFNGSKGYIPTSALSYTIADCNGNSIPDACDIADGTSTDCNGNGIPDECDIESGTSSDCNNNGIPDECEIAVDSTAPGGPFYCTQDCNPDCNDNGIPDDCDIGFGTSTDCNANGIPDECEIASGAADDCNHNGIPDECDIASGASIDCNFNGRPDDCDIADDPGLDANGDGFIDSCSLFVGDEIVPPSGYTAQVEPAIDPGTKAFWHPSEKKVFTKEQGSVNIGWIEDPGARTAAAPTVAVATVTYGILPATPTVSIYLTDPPPRSGPAVDLTNILQGTPRVRPIVHFNSTFTSSNDAWVDVLNQLRVSKLGSFLFEYREEFGGQRLVAFEVVQVRPPEADYIVAVEVGDELRPSSTDEVSCRPAVTRGLLPPSPFLFQVSEAGPTQDRVFAIRPTDNPINMEVYWLRESFGGVCWPFELTRYTATWPTAPQLNVYGTGDIPKVDMSAHEQAIIEYQTPAGHGVISDRKLTVTGPGWATIRYSDPVTEGRLVQFEVARTIAHDGGDPSLEPPVQWPIRTAWEIGEALADPVHDTGCFPSGYVYSGTAYDGSIYGFGAAESRIIPVNRGAIEVWWHQNSLGVCWPVKPVRYDCDWPAVPDHCLVIANEQGVGPFSPSKYLDPSIYELGGIADDRNTVGYNPNEEHAEWVTNPGDLIYAARDDYNAVHGRSEPYVLLKFRNNLLPDKPWEFDLIRVARSIANGPVGGCTCAVEPCDFVYPVTAGTPLFPPAPLVFRTLCQENRLTDESLLWDDDKGNKWFRRGDVATNAEYFENWRGEGCMPWLDDGTGDPQDVTWNVGWPQIAADPPRIVGGPAQNIYTPLAFGSTRDRSTFTSAEILYNDSGAVLIKPWTVTAVPLLRDSLPDEYLSLYNKLAPHLRARLSYDDVNEELRWAGVASRNLLGIMSEADRDGILAVFEAAPDSEGFNAAVGALHLATQQSGAGDVGTYLGPPRRERDDPDWSSSWGIALSAGSATSEGWIVVGYNGNADIPDPVQVEVFRVGCPPDAGLIFVVEPDCPFDEQLALRWSGDCGGDCKDFEFYWQVAAGDNPDDYDDIDPGSAPGDKPPFNPWEDYTDPERNNASGWVRGQNEIVIRGANIRTLTDNWFHVMVRVPPDTEPAATACVPGATSGFTPAQLAEGWIKRVKRALNPFDQRIKDFTDTRVQTYVSMIEQLGNPYIDTINLSCRADVVNRLGLIELYQAVLLRGRSFTVDQGLRYPPANQALMLISGNLVDFYTLLGNEAYGDSLDPMVTIDVGTSAPPTSIFAFQDQLPTNENSLLYEELALLRGRDGRSGTPLDRFPVHNRLYWNFTSGDGQVAYKNAYDIQDVYPNNPDGSRGDGFFTEDDARVMFPQGHGDAWGHYLTGVRFYYDLLRHTRFDWENRTEAVLVNQVPVQVSYAHERRLARTAAARARTAEAIMDLTYREHYSEDPAKQWQGYPDPVAERHWGVFDWGQRSMQAAYFDWLAGNASIPALDDDPEHAGTIKRVDRTTVTALGEIASHADAIQTLLDQADAGLNPLGLAKNIVPFDIDPTLLASQTHFEQVYSRANQALTNAVNVFNHANQASQSLRRTADEAQQFENNVEDREADFNSRLIEIFGSPFPDDRNPLTGELYGADFNGPDLYHWMYIEEEELLGVSLPAGRTLTLDFRVLSVDPDTGALDQNATVAVPYNIVPGFGLIKPGSWTRPRRAPGELQLAQSEMVQALRRFEQARVEYDTLIRDIEDQAELLEKNYDVRRDQLQIRERQRNRTIWFNSALTVSKGIQLTQARVAQVTDRTSEIISDCLPKIVGFSNDVSSPVSCGIKQAGFSFSLAFAIAADIAALSDVGIAGAKEVLAQQTEIDLISLQGEYDKLAALKELEQKIRSLRAKEVELFSLVQAMRQRNAAYMQLLARGKRILDDRTAFRQQTAEAVSNYRYKDMAFRIFRNDALQKYRAQFDLAARYTYLAARAFEYETNLLHSDALSGEGLLSAVVRERVLGDVTDGVPHQGPGLAGTLASLNDNFQVLKGQLGFNNPTLATNKFSLRRELFRIHPEASTGDEVWRETLRRHTVRDLRTEVPEFDQFISPFAPYDVINGEPAIVLEFRTAVQSDINFFGQPGSTSGGESFFPSDYFSIKVRGVGVWFTEYDAGASGLSATPRCYLVPIGSDIMRIPFTRDLTGGQQLRVWDVVDQILPLPNILTAAQFAPRQNGWRPSNQLPGTLLQAQTRRYPSIGVYPDLRAGQNDVNLAEFDLSTQLVGRSVWNDKWLLIIPGRFLLQGNPAEGVRRFIEGNAGNDGVADIRLAFQTYQYAGAGAAQSADVSLAVLSADEPAPAPQPAADFRAQLAEVLAGESVSEPSMLLYGRLRTPSGTPIRAGRLRFEFTPEAGGNPLSVIANLEDFAEGVDYLARLPLVAAPAGDTAALELGARYTARVFYDDTELARQLDEPFVPRRGSILGPLDYQTGALTPTATPTRTPTPTLTHTPSGPVVGEVGRIAAVTQQWQQVNLARSYTNPVVICGPPSNDESAPAAVRLRLVGGNRFQVRLAEPGPCEDGVHLAETVDYLVVEAGTYELPDGFVLEAGTRSSAAHGGSVEDVSFAVAFAEAPVVLAQVQTSADAAFVRTRLAELPSATGFRVGLEAVEGAGPNCPCDLHTGAETIGWVALSRGGGTVEGNAVDAGRTEGTFTDNWHTVTFGQTFATPPLLLAQLQSRESADPAGLRYRNLAAETVEIKVEEDDCADAEVSHPGEVVGYVAFARAGLLAEYATPGPTDTPGGPTQTPTSTPTPSDTPGGPTATPTDTPGGPTATPTSTATVTPTITIEPGAELPPKALDWNGDGLLDREDLLHWMNRYSSGEALRFGEVEYQMHELLLIFSRHWMTPVS